LHLYSQHHWPHLSSNFHIGKRKFELQASPASRQMDACVFRTSQSVYLQTLLISVQSRGSPRTTPGAKFTLLDI
jgi:hypothetical protein